MKSIGTNYQSGCLQVDVKSLVDRFGLMKGRKTSDITCNVQIDEYKQK